MLLYISYKWYSMIMLDKPEYRRIKIIEEVNRHIQKRLDNICPSLIEDTKIFPGIHFKSRMNSDGTEMRCKFFLNEQVADKNDLDIVDDLLLSRYDFLSKEWFERYSIMLEHSWGLMDVVFHDIPSPYKK